MVPALFMPDTFEYVAPSAARSRMASPSNRNACAVVSETAALPAMWPLALMADAKLLSFPPSVPRSTDGIAWTPARVASGTSPTKTDVLPYLYPDNSGTVWSVLWVNEDGVVTLPVDGTFPWT